MVLLLLILVKVVTALSALRKELLQFARSARMEFASFARTESAQSAVEMDNA
jgi:hypothetical protein